MVKLGQLSGVLDVGGGSEWLWKVCKVDIEAVSDKGRKVWLLLPRAIRRVGWSWLAGALESF